MKTGEETGGKHAAFDYRHTATLLAHNGCAAALLKLGNARAVGICIFTHCSCRLLLQAAAAAVSLAALAITITHIQQLLLCESHRLLVAGPPMAPLPQPPILIYAFACSFFGGP